MIKIKNSTLVLVALHGSGHDPHRAGKGGAFQEVAELSNNHILLPGSVCVCLILLVLTVLTLQVLGGAISAVITYHNTENRPKGGICVANHTSPIDVCMLASDTAYALVYTIHGVYNIIFLNRQGRSTGGSWAMFRHSCLKPHHRSGLRGASLKTEPMCLTG